jgi:4-amino-4-deoxy-L-arabinose transferase-like glycosyltransferase
MPKSLLGILLIALLLRAGIACGLQYQLENQWNRSFLIEGDANGYWELGTKIANGDAYEIYDPPRRILRMPGFPLFLAGAIKMSSGSYLFARLTLAVVGTLCCLLVYLLGKELFDKQVGLIAAGWCAITPIYAGFSVVLLSETLFALLMLINLWLGTLLYQKIKDGQSGLFLSIATGVLIGLGTLVRPSWILATLILAVFMILISEKKMKGFITASLIIAGLIVTLLPWTIRNHQVSGHWVVTSLWSGPSLYDGLNPNATGTSDMKFFEEDQILDRMTEFEMNQHYQSKAIQFAKENPSRAMELSIIKLGRFWNLWPNADQFQNPFLKVAVVAFFAPLIIFSLIGLLKYRKQGVILLMTVGPIAYFSLIHLLFIGSLRYRLPAEFPLSVLASAGLIALWNLEGKPEIKAVKNSGK